MGTCDFCLLDLEDEDVFINVIGDISGRVTKEKKIYMCAECNGNFDRVVNNQDYKDFHYCDKKSIINIVKIKITCWKIEQKIKKIKRYTQELCKNN